MTHIDSNRTRGVTPWQEVLINEALASLPPNPSTREKADAMQALVEKLTALREFEQWDPRHLESVVLKRNYRLVDRIEDNKGTIFCLHALPDGRIISGCVDGGIRIWSRESKGRWTSEKLCGLFEEISCLHALPDGRIVSGGGDGSIRLWSKCGDGSWASEGFSADTFYLNCFQVLPDGSIISGGLGGHIKLWTRKHGE